MTRRRQRRLLPDAIASAWVREIHYQSPITAKAVRLFHQAARPIDAEIAAALAPSERLANGIIRLHVPIGETFRLYGIEPGQIDWLIDFDPKTGKWHPHSADVTHSGIAAHPKASCQGSSAGSAPANLQRSAAGLPGSEISIANSAENRHDASARRSRAG
jgi:hypothetical protein